MFWGEIVGWGKVLIEHDLYVPDQSLAFILEDWGWFRLEPVKAADTEGKHS